MNCCRTFGPSPSYFTRMEFMGTIEWYTLACLRDVSKERAAFEAKADDVSIRSANLIDMNQIQVSNQRKSFSYFQ
jgi:hypothetical protein